MSLLDCRDSALIIAAMESYMAKGAKVKDNMDGHRKDLIIKREFFDDFIVCSLNKNTPLEQWDLIPKMLLKVFTIGVHHGESREAERVHKVIFGDKPNDSITTSKS